MINVTNYEIMYCRVYNTANFESIDVKQGGGYGKIHHNDVSPNMSCGIYIDAQGQNMSYIDTYNNVIHGGNLNGVRGIAYAVEVSGSLSHCKIYNNVVYGVGASGIVPGASYSAGPVDDIVVANNTVYNNGAATSWGSGLSVEYSSATNIVLRNNISYNNRVNLQTNNSTTQDKNLIGVDPKFVNPGIGDLHLQSNSPAINAGSSAAFVPSADYDGNSRPQGAGYDIGAYEFGSSPPSPNSAFCNSAQAPAIDGVAENLWAQVKTDTLKKIIIGTTISAADLSVNCKAMWDNTALYLLLNVKDDTLINDSGANTWDDDALEIFVDGNNDKAASYDANDHHYIFRVNDANVYEYKNGPLPANPAGITFAQGNYSGGYLMEIKILWTSIGVTVPGGKLMGLDIHINDDDNGSARDAKMTWIAQMDLSSTDPSIFGTIKLDNSCVVTTGLEKEVYSCSTLVYPTLFHTNFTVKISQNIQIRNAGMKIYDLSGKEVISIPLDHHETTIARGELSGGLYCYRIINGNENIATGRLIAR